MDAQIAQQPRKKATGPAESTLGILLLDIELPGRNLAEDHAALQGRGEHAVAHSLGAASDQRDVPRIAVVDIRRAGAGQRRIRRWRFEVCANVLG